MLIVVGGREGGSYDNGVCVGEDKSHLRYPLLTLDGSIIGGIGEGSILPSDIELEVIWL